MEKIKKVLLLLIIAVVYASLDVGFAYSNDGYATVSTGSYSSGSINGSSSNVSVHSSTDSYNAVNMNGYSSNSYATASGYIDGHSDNGNVITSVIAGSSVYSYGVGAISSVSSSISADMTTNSNNSYASSSASISYPGNATQLTSRDFSRPAKTRKDSTLLSFLTYYASAWGFVAFMLMLLRKTKKEKGEEKEEEPKSKLDAFRDKIDTINNVKQKINNQSIRTLLDKFCDYTTNLTALWKKNPNKLNNASILVLQEVEQIIKEFESLSNDSMITLTDDQIAELKGSIENANDFFMKKYAEIKNGRNLRFKISTLKQFTTRVQV